LSARPEILDAYLFGSYARGDDGAHSDVDVAVYVDFACVLDSFVGYSAELTAELVRTLGSDAVDVVVLNHAPPLLYHRVLRDGVRLLARNQTATTTREGQALSRFCDYVPHLRKIDAAHSARIASGNFGR
jgi:predicted nucleotidyltransferase